MKKLRGEAEFVPKVHSDNESWVLITNGNERKKELPFLVLNTLGVLQVINRRQTKLVLVTNRFQFFYRYQTRRGKITERRFDLKTFETKEEDEKEGDEREKGMTETSGDSVNRVRRALSEKLVTVWPVSPASEWRNLISSQNSNFLTEH